MVIPLRPGAGVWADLGDGVGREQSGRRPVVVISTVDHLALADQLVSVVPSTSVDRAWPNHVELDGETGLKRPTFAMTEQPRAISRSRLHRYSGVVSDACLSDIATWVDDWLVRPAV